MYFKDITFGMQNTKYIKKNVYLLQIASDPVLTVILHVGRFGFKPGVNTYNDIKSVIAW